MKREELEHIIRATTDLTKEKEFIVIGSQSILGQYPNAPEDLLVSREADIICMYDPDNSDLIEGTLGELSQFHNTHGYYAQGVSLELPILPNGWEGRCHDIQCVGINGVVSTAHCIEIHDTCISKYAISREKDIQYIKSCIENKLIDKEIMLERLAITDISKDDSEIIEKRIQHDFS